MMFASETVVWHQCGLWAGERRQSREKAKGYIVIVVRNSPITIKSYTTTCNINVGIPHYIYETP